MNRLLLSSLTIVMCMGVLQAAAPKSDSVKPEYTSDNQLLSPKNFREWIFLSSGLGMSYNAGSSDHVMFTNVFVPQWAYSEFIKSGKWPDKTVFVVEERGSETKGSINKVGHFQTDLMGYGVEVKDERASPKSGPTSISTKPRNQRRPILSPPAGNVMKTMPPSNIPSCSFIPR